MNSVLQSIWSQITCQTPVMPEKKNFIKKKQKKKIPLIMMDFLA